jgi:hypothetical protein
MTLTRPLVRPHFAKASAVMFLLLVPFVAHAIWDYVEARRLRVRVEAIAARGEPLTVRETEIVELTGAAAESDRYYRAAAALVSDDYDEGVPVPSTTWYRIATAERDRVWPPELLAVIRDAVDRNADALALVDRASSLQFEGLSPGTSYTYQMSAILRLVRLCDWRAVLRAADGNSESAFDSLYSEARLARATGSPPQAATTFIRLSALPFVLDRGRASATARTRLDHALAELDREGYLKAQFLRTRAMLIDEHLAGERRAARIAWTSPMQTWRRHRMVQALDDYEPVLRAAERPWPEPLQALPALADAPRAARRAYDRSSLEGAAKMWARLAQTLRCARLRVGDGTLKLVDPYTGRLLELVNCKL